MRIQQIMKSWICGIREGSFTCSVSFIQSVIICVSRRQMAMFTLSIKGIVKQVEWVKNPLSPLFHWHNAEQ